MTNTNEHSSNGRPALNIRPASEFQSGEPGLYADVPMEEYARMSGVSNTALSIIHEDNEAKLAWTRANPKPPTAAQIFGRRAHACVLEPERFDAHFDKAAQCRGITGKGTQCKNGGSSRVGGKWYCGTHLAQAPGEPDQIEAIGDGDFDDLLGMRKACKAHPIVGRLLSLPSYRELSGLWIDEATGLRCKMRIDLLLPEHQAIFDYKTISPSVSDEDVSWAIWKHGYLRQAPMYLSGCRALNLPVTDFGFFFQEKEGPYFVRPFRIDEATLAVGAEQLRHLMKRHKRAKELDLWPGYEDGDQIIPIGLPEKVIKYDLSDGERSAIMHGGVVL